MLLFPKHFCPQYRKAFVEYRRNCLTELVGQISGTLRALDHAPRVAAYVWGVHEFKNTRDWGAWLAHGYLDMLNLTGYSYREQYGDKYLEVLDQRFADAEAVIRRLDNPVEFTICVGISTSHGKIRAASELPWLTAVAGVGKVIDIEVWRGGARRRFSVEIGAMPE